MNINPEPAIAIEYKPKDTFDAFAQDVATETRIALRPFGMQPSEYAKLDGEAKKIAPKVFRIELEEGYEYSCLLLKMKKIFTPEKFSKLQPHVENALTAAVMAGDIEPDDIVDFMTAFELKPPPIPEKLKGTPHKYCLNGDLGLVVEEVVVQPEMDM